MVQAIEVKYSHCEEQVVCDNYLASYSITFVGLALSGANQDAQILVFEDTPFVSCCKLVMPPFGFVGQESVSVSCCVFVHLTVRNVCRRVEVGGTARAISFK